MMDAAKLRAWYAHRQGLDGSLEGKSAAEVLQQGGWARSVGGASPYLALFARAGISREQADEAARKLEIYELPSARGCTYVLPAEDFALGLAAGRGFDGEIKTALKLGVTEKEIDKLCEAVLKRAGERPTRSRRSAWSYRQSRPQPGARRHEKRPQHHAPGGARQVAGIWRHPARSRKRALRSTALSIRVVAPESAARIQIIARGSTHGTGGKVFQVVRARIGCGISALLRARSQSS